MSNLTRSEDRDAPRTLRDAFLSLRSPRVLLAEDNTDMREMLEGALRRDGYHVVSVADGDRLLAVIEARQPYQCVPEMIVSDVLMPGRSGLEVLEQLRRTDWYTPVILITAFGDPETRQHAERLGAVLLDKPFLLDDLRTAAHDLQRVRVQRVSS